MNVPQFIFLEVTKLEDSFEVSLMDKRNHCKIDFKIFPMPSNDIEAKRMIDEYKNLISDL